MKGFIGPIKEIALGIYDGPHATPPEAESGPVYLGIKNVSDSGRLDFSDIRHLSEYDFTKWTRRVTPKKDDIVFSYEATLHRYALIPEGFRGCLGRRLALIRPNTEKVIPRFLLYYFLSFQWHSKIESNITSGATVDRIPIKRFPDFEIQIPALHIQEKIVSILSAYDDLIENNLRRIQLLELSARLFYKEWFIRLRFPGYEHVKNKNGVPEGWKKKQLGEIAPLKYGKSLKKDDRIPGPYPVYGSSGVVGFHKKALVKGPGIIIGRKGNVGSIFWSADNFYPIDTVYFIEAENSNLYLYYALLHTVFLSTDVAVPGLNRDLAHSRTVSIPTPDILDAFEKFLSPIHEQIINLQRYNVQLSKARDLLLPRLMNGEISP